jgi:pilus assembly protein CpaE
MTRILVVDDSPLSLRLTTDTLAQAGYEVFSAKSGPEALKSVDGIKPELVILDVMMPELDGYEVCRRLRQKPNTAHLPIVMLTAQDTLEEKVKGFEAGADEYMIKPFQPVEFLARIKVLLRRAPPPPLLVQPQEAPARKSKIIAAFSLRGGVGVSSLAANLATGLAQLWEAPVVLIDMALTAGQSALMLNLAPRNTWADLAQVPVEQIDIDLMNSLLLQHSSGVYVLAVPRHPEQTELITPDKVAHVLNLLKEHYNYLILDLPHDFHATTLAGLDTADLILAMMAPDLASVLTMASTLEVFQTLEYPRERVRLVLNHVFEKNGLAQKVIEDALSQPFDLVIPFAADICVQAINMGNPLILGAPNSPVAALLEDYAFHVSTEEHRKQRPATPSKSWQRVARRLQPRQQKK